MLISRILARRFCRSVFDAGEEYQDLFARVCAILQTIRPRPAHIRHMSNLWFMPSTPVLSNGSTDRGLPISYFLNEATDSLDGIVNLWNENVWLASLGGGIGSYWGNLRSIGEKVGANGKTSGIIPFMRVMDSLTLAFLRGRSGADRRRSIFASTIQRLRNSSNYAVRPAVIQPQGPEPAPWYHYHRRVHACGRERRGMGPQEPKGRAIIRKVSAPQCGSVCCRPDQTGEPYLLYIDHVNKAIPEHHKLAGLEVKMSNLCSEITLPTVLTRIANRERPCAACRR